MVWIYLLLACILCYYILSSNTTRGLKKLPSPPDRLFYFGHFFQIGDKPHKKFTEWARSLGDIYSIQLGQQNWIILTSDKVVGELLQKRGAKYSTRVPSHYTFKILTRGKSYAASPYNERYRKINPIMHSVSGQRSVKENSYLLDDEYRILMQNLCQASAKTKDGFYPKYFFQLTALNVISLLCLNKRTDSIDDPFYIEFENLMGTHLELAKVTNRLSEYFPILKWFPNTKLHNAMIESAGSMEVFLRKLVKEVIDDKEKKPCIIRELLRKKDEGILDDLDVIYLTDSIFAAGTDTISASLTWLTAALANNPHVQSKAHQELDRIIEGQRYCGALYLGIPHGIEEDDEYNGYHIPANSVVVLNQYGIHMDEKRYENPKEFKPERFLGFTESSAVLANGNYENRDHFGFGAGRRLCT
ncbi:cytochrome P450 [Gigaspora rosea]|uniref:Cytochrome P450 n=1 Tax=Gigaspora rosea TaxID=44941 RepID=A0A397W9N6_9GLOM|nr:cytochrome P450 [Gigaspora rosea]